MASATAGDGGLGSTAGHIAVSCRKGGNQNLYPVGEEESEVNDEAFDVVSVARERT